ncbi:hypothetical protein [Nonomuraea sp. NPDC049709]
MRRGPGTRGAADGVDVECGLIGDLEATLVVAGLQASSVYAADTTTI